MGCIYVRVSLSGSGANGCWGPLRQKHLSTTNLTRPVVFRSLNLQRRIRPFQPVGPHRRQWRPPEEGGGGRKVQREPTRLRGVVCLPSGRNPRRGAYLRRLQARLAPFPSEPRRRARVRRRGQCGGDGDAGEALEVQQTVQARRGCQGSDRRCGVHREVGPGWAIPGAECVMAQASSMIAHDSSCWSCVPR